MLNFTISAQDKNVFDQLRKRVSPIINFAELHFGQRIKGYRYLGVQFHKAPPTIGFDKEGVRIYLNESARNSAPHAYFQLAHEVVHLLAPVSRKEVTVLEEGMATWFSVQALAQILPDSNFALRSIAKTNYQHPYDLVNTLLKEHPNCIKRVRGLEPQISLLTAAQFEQVIPQIDPELIAALLQPMN